VRLGSDRTVRAVLVGLAYVAVTCVAVVGALLPNVGERVDLQQVMIESPPGQWEVVPSQSGVLSERLLVNLGIPPAAARALGEVRGFVRTWVSPSGSAVVAYALDLESSRRGGEFLDGWLDAGEARGREFDVPDVDGARGFVVPGAARGVSAVQVAFRRGELAFLFSILGRRPELGVARSLASAQSARSPAGETERGDEWHDAGALVGSAVAAVSIYLLIVGGIAWLADYRAHTGRRQRSGADEGEATTEHAVVDVSQVVRARRRVARAAFSAKVFGTSLALPLFYPPMWPSSLFLLVLGVVLVALGIGLERGRRGAAVGLLVLSALVVLGLITAPLALLFAPGAVIVLRRPVSATRVRGYRRVFTGRRIGRVAGLLAVSALVAVVGLFALVTSVIGGSDAETGARQSLSALACLALAVLPYRQARRHAGLQAAAATERDERAPVLYLRSFRDDRLKIRARGGSPRHSALERFGARRRERFEEVVAGHLWAYGPVIAVSEPGEQLAPIGAARAQFDDATWQEGVATWLTRSRLVVITVGRTAGLAWEVAKVTELGLWGRTILVFPPIGPAELTDRWDALRAAAATAGVELVLRCDPSHALAAALVDSKLVAFVGARRDEWHYEACLHAAARELLASLDHVEMRQVEADAAAD
jgi:hypothetical protein